MKKNLFLVGLLFISTSFSTLAAELTFKVHGKEVAKFTIEELKKTNALTTVQVFDPTLGAMTSYQAFDFKALLNSVYKNDHKDQLKSAEEVLFTCSDGYQPSIPMQQFENHTAYLAVSAGVNGPFEVVHKSDGSNKKISLGPTYLIWKDDPEVRADVETDWPYQVVSVDLVSFEERFPKLSPPGGAKGVSPQVKRGFLEFRKFCVVCHTINGEGGAKAPDLNYPVNVTEYFKEEWFYKFVNNPQSVRLHSGMSAFSGQIENNRLHLKDVFAYLKSMQKRKIKPDTVK